MMIDPVKTSAEIKEEFISYISTYFHIEDKEYNRLFKYALCEEGAIAKGPYLDITDSYESGESINSLIREGQMSPIFTNLENDVPEEKKEIKLERGLYKHQEKAIRRSNMGRNLVVTTGTGSGKTECFLLPIINSLLQEIEQGTLDDGVRAILIYPMNALANDQMKRLRRILGGFPKITFGVYNSSTKQKEKDGVIEFGKYHKDEAGYPLKPLANEMLSRERMRSTPPHILVTNYAMLEYMMLRPNDDIVFSEAKLHYLVLDEAHIYRGATGIETSILLRRVKARLGHPEKVQHIITSATLGGLEHDDEIIRFAETLCSSKFEAQDIIRASRIVPPMPQETIDVSWEAFDEMAHPQRPLNIILDHAGVEYDRTQPDAAILYDICLRSKAYKVFRASVQGPMTVAEIRTAMSQSMALSENDVVNLVNVASQAEKDKMVLLKARYHMFVRAMEGAYITLPPHRNLFLARKNSIETEKGPQRVFEIGVCNTCGRMALAGHHDEKHEILEQVGNRFSDDIDYFLLVKNGESLYTPDEADDVPDGVEKDEYWLCPYCGEMHSRTQKERFHCGHPQENLVLVHKVPRNKEKHLGKCPACGFGRLRLFYLGYEAATAVLGTELYEQLPSQKVRLASDYDEKISLAKTGLFGGGRKTKKMAAVNRERQFLVFSDSRSDAAFFATYMSHYYEEFLRRRGVWHVIRQNQDSISHSPWEVSTLVHEVQAYFESKRSFAPPGDNGQNLGAESRRQAWMAVLNEMISARRSTSLASLGVIGFEYKGNSEEAMSAFAQRYHRSQTDMKALFNLLAMDIVFNGAIESEFNSWTDADREYLYYSPGHHYFKRMCTKDDGSYCHSWLPRRGSNGRLDRLVRGLGIDKEEAQEILSAYWDEILLSGEYNLESAGDDKYYFSTKDFVVVAGSRERPLYQCDKCGKTTLVNCGNQCASVKCDGRLHPISYAEMMADNHYAKLYDSEQMSPLHILEHTAQLGRNEQREYQEMFIKKQINALSCSTTFEMGVDVGDLETVYLRDMPPSPANYVQRAGRAGRSVHSAAYALTFAKLSSHDFTYFNHPERMIAGEIGVPIFALKNEKVVQRHIFAVAMSAFFAGHEDIYDNNNADRFLNGDGYEQLLEYLDSRPEGLRDLLLKSIPSEMQASMGIQDFGWLKRMIGERGLLSEAVNDYREIVKWYENGWRNALKKQDAHTANAMEMQLKKYRKGKDDGQGRNDLIEFLARNNVLPKYGFPVDTVELHQINDYRDTSPKKNLQLVRDLQLAIAEYAPGSQIVADGKLFTSRYIRKLPNKSGQTWDDVYIAECPNPACKTWNYSRKPIDAEGKSCSSCGQVIPARKWKKAIEPRKGFTASAEVKDVPMHKPERLYRGEDYYIADPERQSTKKLMFKVGNDYRLQLETTGHDSLLVACDSDFYVCHVCGYAESFQEAYDNKDVESYVQRKISKKHKTPWGKICKGEDLHKRKLCHTFQTDVIRVTFGTAYARTVNVMWSVMYALLEAASDVLSIERTDIKGCLHKVQYGNSLINEIVLYDAVAGGAGHVSRLAVDEGTLFQKVIKRAVEITNMCTCDSSCYNCLRNYYNQKQHDILDRKSAANFLSRFMIPWERCEESNFVPRKINNDASNINEVSFLADMATPISEYADWQEFQDMLPPEWKPWVRMLEEREVPLPDYAYGDLEYKEKYAYYFAWERSHLLVMADSFNKLKIDGWHVFSGQNYDLRDILKILKGDK